MGIPAIPSFSPLIPAILSLAIIGWTKIFCADFIGVGQ
jgi:hypothetical protein